MTYGDASITRCSCCGAWRLRTRCCSTCGDRTNNDDGRGLP